MSKISVISRLNHGRYLFSTDSLFRNATYLAASTAVMSVLGFLFWIFVAHLYSATQIGEASTLIAIATLISNLSLLGLNSGMIRFLPKSKQSSSDINAISIAVGVTTLVVSALYAFVGVHITGHIEMLSSIGAKFAFSVLMTAVSLNSVTDAVFIANRRGEYHTAGYGMLGFVKLLLPLFFVPFGAVGVFGAFILAMLASLILSYYLMWRGCGYHFFAKPNWSVIRETRRYAAHNYLGTLINGLPSQLMPLFIIHSLGTSSVAYFSMAWTMANLLYVVPAAAMQSLLAETSNRPDMKQALIKRSIRMLTLIIIPTVVIAVVVAPYVLDLFGPAYRHHGTVIFQLFALATFCVAIATVGNTALNIERKTGGVVSTQIVNVVVTFASAIWLVHYGLDGIGVSIGLGNLAAALMYLVLMARLKHDKSNAYKPEQTSSPAI